MGGPNLEIFKFALYIFTPVVTMRMSFSSPIPSPFHSLSISLSLPSLPSLSPISPPFLLPLLTHSLTHTLPATVYFGTNLDQRFAVPDFWPRPEETHRIPFERAEIVAEMERLKRKRLWLREQRLRNGAREARGDVRAGAGEGRREGEGDEEGG